MNFESRVHIKKELLNDTDELIVEYIKKHNKDILNMSIHKVSADLYTAPNSIMRFCKKIGYSGFSELKFSLSQDTEHIETSSTKVLERLPSSIIKTLDIIEQDVQNIFVDEIIKANKILFVGVGDSFFHCEIMGRSLRFLGMNTEFYNNMHDIEFIASKLKRNDLVIFISGRGANERQIRLAKKLKENNINALAITKYGKNTLGDLCKHQLCYWSREKLHNDYLMVDRSGLAMLSQILVDSVYKKLCD